MKISRNVITPVVCGVLLLMLCLASCGSSGATYAGYTGSSKGNTWQASYQLFNGKEEKKIYVPISYTLNLNFQSVVEKGSLTLQLLGPEKNVVLNITPNTSGSHMLMADKTGNFYLDVTGNDTSGSYNFTWGIKYSGS